MEAAVVKGRVYSVGENFGWSVPNLYTSWAHAHWQLAITLVD